MMKIGIMAAWNTTSGVAMHAEPLGKALRDMGHKVHVFSFLKTDYHGEGITAKDEKYVTRCFGTRNNTNSLDSRPFLERDYDVLLVEDTGMLPVDKLNNLFPVLKNKAKLVHVVHENRMTRHSWFYQHDWDKVVYFDHRQDFLKKIYPDAEYIPFPCFASRRGSKIEARKRLDLPLKKKIVYSFGHRGYHSYYRDLPPKLKKNTILLHVVPKEYQMLEELHPTDWMLVKPQNVITTQQFDDYLFASDAAILHKFTSRGHAVVSSTVYQALGAGCPIFVPSLSDFFHDWKNELMHYKDVTALSKQLVGVLGSEKKKKQIIENAERFVEKHSPERIAQKFVDLFERILS
ncbi:MAG: glycosyltransferase [Candidatus Omnitrophota bacterium]